MVFIDLPLIAASFWSISAFYVIAQRELHPKSWKRSILMLPMLMGVGGGLTIINTRAVLEALFGVETAFARTPKYAIADRPVKLEVKKYRGRSGWLPYAEILVGTYFSAWWSSRSRLTTSWRFRFCYSSSSAITGRVSARSIRSSRAACAG